MKEGYDDCESSWPKEPLIAAKAKNNANTTSGEGEGDISSENHAHVLRAARTNLAANLPSSLPLAFSSNAGNPFHSEFVTGSVSRLHSKLHSPFLSTLFPSAESTRKQLGGEGGGKGVKKGGVAIEAFARVRSLTAHTNWDQTECERANEPAKEGRRRREDREGNGRGFRIDGRRKSEKG